MKFLTFGNKFDTTPIPNAIPPSMPILNVREGQKLCGLRDPAPTSNVIRLVDLPDVMAGETFLDAKPSLMG